jgi:hypothetical protein
MRIRIQEVKKIQFSDQKLRLYDSLALFEESPSYRRSL